MPFKKGHTINNGRRFSEEHKKKMSEARKIELDKDILIDLYNNKKLSSQEIADILNVSKRTILRRMEDHNIERRHDFTEEKNPNWKGKNTGYAGIHKWLNDNYKKPESCIICGKNKKLELSNKDHKYSRNIKDYQWICHKCHVKYDRENNIWGKGKKYYD